MKKVLFGFAVAAAAVLAAPVLSEATRRGRENTPTLRLADEIGRKQGRSPKVIHFAKMLACKESSCGKNPVATREQSRAWAKDARRLTKDPEVFEALMHSYGALQLSGLYAFKERGIYPGALLDDEVNFEVGLPWAERELAACQGSEYCAAARWNGGPRWHRKDPKTKAQVRAYAEAVMRWKDRV